MRRNICRAFFVFFLCYTYFDNKPLKPRFGAVSRPPLSLTRHLPPAGGSLSYQGAGERIGRKTVEDYRTIRGTAIGEYEEKKSRFIAQLSFADSEEAAVAFLEKVRAEKPHRPPQRLCLPPEGGQPGALLRRRRTGEDGGHPALEVLQHSGLTDLIVVVTRYFGGVLLGTGGLVRAYTTATARALENAEVVTVRSVIELSVTVDYSLYERASLLIQGAGAKLAEPEFTDRVALRWQMPEGTEGPLLEQLRGTDPGAGQM